MSLAAAFDESAARRRLAMGWAMGTSALWIAPLALMAASVAAFLSFSAQSGVTDSDLRTYPILIFLSLVIPGGSFSLATTGGVGAACLFVERVGRLQLSTPIPAWLIGVGAAFAGGAVAGVFSSGAIYLGNEVWTWTG